MGFTTTDNISTRWGFDCSWAYFNIQECKVSLQKNDLGTFDIECLFQIFNSNADRDAVPSKQVLAYDYFRATVGAVPESNLWSLAYDLFKDEKAFTNVVNFLWLLVKWRTIY